MNYQRIYANVMEQCMRRSAGHVVRIDRLLLHARGDMVTAEFRANDVHKRRAFRIHNDTALDVEYVPMHWRDPVAGIITPHGDLKDI